MLDTFMAVLRPFARQAGISAYHATYYGGGPRIIASSPFLDGWRQVNDAGWPLNWNPHHVWHKLNPEDGSIAVWVTPIR